MDPTFSSTETPHVAPPPPPPPGATAPLGSDWAVTAIYSWTDETGNVLYEKVRQERILPDGRHDKKFQQRRPNPDGTGHLYNLQDVRRIPYRLHKLVEARDQDVHCVEGEKDAHAVEALGLCATFVPSPKKADLDVFRGRNVVIHADNDNEGRRKAHALALALTGIAASVRIVEYPELPSGGDVSDFIAQGNGLEDVLARCEEAAEFTPPTGKRPRADNQLSGARTGTPLKRGMANAQKVLEVFGTELVSLGPGPNCRNKKLNDAAYVLGRMSARGWISKDHVWPFLRAACEANGLWSEDPSKVRATFESGWKAGLRNPHDDLPDRSKGGTWRTNGYAHNRDSADRSGGGMNGSASDDNCTGDGRTDFSEVDEILALLPEWVVDLARTGAVEHAVQVFMDHGLSDDQIRLLAQNGVVAAYDHFHQVVKDARVRFLGEARRMRTSAQYVHDEPQGADASEHATNTIDGAALLDDICTFLKRFVAYPSEAACSAHALWCVHTHLMEAWESTPRLNFYSKEPSSGKTRCLEVTEPLVLNPIETVNVSPAYIFRKVGEADTPVTILFDEVDTILGPKAKDANEDLRGLINAGHRRGAFVGRCVMVGNKAVPEEIPAFAAIALAGLGDLPDTISTRSVSIGLRRRLPDEKIEPYRRRVHHKQGAALRARIEMWADQIRETVTAVWPEMPEGVEDRNADVWEALLAIADAAGGEWPKRARVAAQEIVGSARDDPKSLGIWLLTDLREIFAAFKNPDHLGTEKILEKLCELEESPWGDLRGKAMTNRVLARMLKPYGVRPKVIRDGPITLRGYTREDLHDPWQRYLPPPAGTVITETDVTTLQSSSALDLKHEGNINVTSPTKEGRSQCL